VSSIADTPPPGRPRIEALDLARGLALLAMASYHFTWDLEFFGYADPGMTAVGGWKLYARCIASTFLVLVGISLVLAHGDGIRWKGFARRLAMVAGAALAITAATWWFVPEGMIFFGILHQIALASVLGLAFLRWPPLLTLAVAALVVLAPHYLRSDFFDHPALWWVGLAPVNPRSNDYVPLFPWFGAVLAGIGLGRFAIDSGLVLRFAAFHPGPWSRPLRFAGRHSLAVYLIHQPVLIGLIWLFAQVYPAAELPRPAQFTSSCERSCEQTRDAGFCARYCGCMLEALEQDGKLDALFAGDGSAELRAQVEDLAAQCTARTETTPPGG